MAITLENANKVWMRANVTLVSASPGAQRIFKELKAWLATQKGNPDLAIIGVGDLGADAVVADAPTKVYGIYLKKGNTATGTFLKAADHASSAGTTASDLVMELNAANQELCLTYPNGWAQGTGFTIGSDTTADGSTAATAGDGPSGFVIIGAP